jgi:plasmid maintenance system antidote protein VapI
MNRSKPKLTVTNQLRALIRESGVTCYQIAKATGVSNATLSRFLSGERGLSCEAMDAIGEYFGWQVVATDSQPEPKGR